MIANPLVTRAVPHTFLSSTQLGGRSAGPSALPNRRSTSAATRGVLHDLRREIASSRHRAQLARGGVPLSSITPKRPDAPRPSRRAVIARRGAAGPRRLVEDAPAQTVGDSALGKGPLEVEEEPPYLPYTSRRARTPPIRVLSADEYRRRCVPALRLPRPGCCFRLTSRFPVSAAWSAC